MTTYLTYIRLLKSGAVINDYNYNPMLERLATMRHVKCFTVLPNIGNVYREYSYEPPVATVQETQTVADVDPKTTSAAALPVFYAPANPLPRDTEVHLWRNYAKGRKPSSGTFSVGQHYIVSKNGMQMECVTLLEKEYYKPFTVLRSQVCTESEYEAYLASLNPIAKAA